MGDVAGATNVFRCVDLTGGNFFTRLRVDAVQIGAESLSLSLSLSLARSLARLQLAPHNVIHAAAAAPRGD